MQQARDFLSESEALEQLVAPLQEEDLKRSTGFKSWTLETILRHLHFWNHMANLTLTSPDDFQAALKPTVEAIMAGKTLPEIEVSPIWTWCLCGSQVFDKSRLRSERLIPPKEWRG